MVTLIAKGEKMYFAFSERDHFALGTEVDQHFESHCGGYPGIKNLNHSRLPPIHNNEKLNFVVFPGISERPVEKTNGYRK